MFKLKGLNCPFYPMKIIIQYNGENVSKEIYFSTVKRVTENLINVKIEAIEESFRFHRVFLFTDNGGMYGWAEKDTIVYADRPLEIKFPVPMNVKPYFHLN